MLYLNLVVHVIKRLRTEAAAAVAAGVAAKQQQPPTIIVILVSEIGRRVLQQKGRRHFLPLLQ